MKVTSTSELRELIEQFIREAIEEKEEQDDEETLDEFSSLAAGSIAGYTLPLGASNKRKGTSSK